MRKQVFTASTQVNTEYLLALVRISGALYMVHTDPQPRPVFMQDTRIGPHQ